MNVCQSVIMVCCRLRYLSTRVQCIPLEAFAVLSRVTARVNCCWDLQQTIKCSHLLLGLFFPRRRLLQPRSHFSAKVDLVTYHSCNVKMHSFLIYISQIPKQNEKLELTLFLSRRTFFYHYYIIIIIIIIFFF